MAAVFSKALFAMMFTALVMAVLASGFQYEVGEERGWRVPTRKDPETLNEWAAKNRFRIGDTVHFKYKRDSVLLVSSADYLKCNTENPIIKYEDGNSAVFKFDRSGLFYFISGEPDHCNLGQRLIIRVMHPSEEVESPAPAPAPVAAGPGGESSRESGNNWGPPPVNATLKLSVVSYFMSTFIGFLVIFYLLV